MKKTESTTQKRQFVGSVVSAKMQKTVVVEIARTVMHPKYKKRYTLTTRLKAHDEKGEYKEGDKVTLEETKPYSRDKRWRVIGRA